MKKRNKHSLSCYKLLSCDMGELVPISLQEVLPGDTFQMSSSLLLRVSPLLAPVMHPVHVRVHHWFVPHRLVWDNWEPFITGGPDGMNASAFPTINSTDYPAQFGVGSLGDYMGVPPDVPNIAFSALPFRGYQLIFNEWYRDQDLISPVTVNKGDGPDLGTNVDLRFIAWEKDYFTSARPWTQKGPEVSIPLTGDAPVIGLGVFDNQSFGPSTVASIGTSPAGSSNAGDIGISSAAAGGAGGTLFVKGQTTGDVSSSNRPQIFADLSGVSAATINDLRTAFALQRFEEARARWGSRYTEYLRYLGVRSSDARLQRPEYLGGGKQTIQFSEVLQTAPGDGSEVGELKGHGIAALRSNKFRRFFEEHGYIFTLLSVRPRTMYVQGLARHFNRRTKEDFWQKELEHIGQQEILNKEVYAAHTVPEGVFGYQDRYDEYRRTESTIGGEFRTSELDFWHMARVFASEPVLNQSFVTSTPTKRIHAAQTNDVLWIMANHSIQCRRMVSRTGSSFIF